MVKHQQWTKRKKTNMMKGNRKKSQEAAEGNHNEPANCRGSLKSRVSDTALED